MKKIIVFLTIVSFIFLYHYLGIIVIDGPFWLLFYLFIAYALSALIFKVQDVIDNNYANDDIAYNNLDVLKYVLSIIIIICHLRPFLGFNQPLDFAFNNFLSRITVPIFFIISGYFIGRKNDRSKIIVYIKKTIPLYLFYSILYIPVMIGFAFYHYDVLVMYMNQFNINFISLIILLPFLIIIGLVYFGTFYHLWYFPALIEALLILYWWIKKRNINSLLVISFILLLFGAIETYYGLIPTCFKGIVDGYFNIFITTRNFLFFGLFYVVLGYKLGMMQKTYTKHLGIKFSISLLLYFVEVFILYQTKRLNSNIYIMAFAVSYYLFMICLNWTKHSYHFNFREYSKYYYLIHPLVIFIIGLISFIKNYPFINLILVLVITHLISFGIIRYKSLTK